MTVIAFVSTIGLGIIYASVFLVENIQDFFLSIAGKRANADAVRSHRTDSKLEYTKDAIKRAKNTDKNADENESQCLYVCIGSLQYYAFIYNVMLIDATLPNSRKPHRLAYLNSTRKQNFLSKQ